MPHLIQHTINGVRRRVRAALAVETLARVSIALGVLFWAWLAVDWMTEPPRSVRLAAYAFASVGLVVWLGRTSLSALLERLPDRRIATWIESGRPELADSLITAVSARSDERDPHTAALVAVSRTRAERLLQRSGRPLVVDFSRLTLPAAAALAAVCSVGLFAVAEPEAMSVYLRRLALSQEAWPRRVVLTVEGFEPDEQGRLTRRVARDSDFHLAARAELTGGHEAPAEVTARLRYQDGARERLPLAAVGEPTRGASAHQAYRLSIDRVRQDAVVRLRGGDARVGPLYVKVVPRPTVTGMELEIAPPDYLSVDPYRVSADAIDRVPEGSRVVLRGLANKPLERVAASHVRGAANRGLDAEVHEDARRFSVAAPPMTEDAAVQISLLDADGIESDGPYQLPLRVKRDAPPRVDFALEGIGPAITPDAVIQTRVRVDDDHAVEAATLRLAAGEENRAIDLGASSRAGEPVQASPAIDLLAMRSDAQLALPRLAPGGSLELRVTARDRYDLDDRSREATSQTETLTIVTAEELTARLVEREVNFRQTFEQVYDEARRVQLSAARVDKPSDDAKPDQEALRARRLAVRRLAEDIEKVAHDTATVGEGFRQVYDELVNNRIQKEDHLSRVGLIVDRLERLAAQRLPALEQSLRDAAETLSDGQEAPSVPPGTERLLAAVVEEMREALDEMKAVENYNQVVALLRGIIDDQRSLMEKTNESRSESLEDFLLE